MGVSFPFDNTFLTTVPLCSYEGADLPSMRPLNCSEDATVACFLFRRSVRPNPLDIRDLSVKSQDVNRSLCHPIIIGSSAISGVLLLVRLCMWPASGQRGRPIIPTGHRRTFCDGFLSGSLLTPRFI